LAQRDIKALMKRVSKENVKQLGRLVGKYSHCAPGLLFDYVSLVEAILPIVFFLISISIATDPIANTNL